MIAATTIEAITLIRESKDLRQKLAANADRFREGMEAAGFTLAGSGHPIIPVMLGEAALATEIANRLLELGVYVIGFSFPVVPQGEARIRTQMSAAHNANHIDAAVEAFRTVGRDLGVVS